MGLMAQMTGVLSSTPKARVPSGRRFYQPELDGLRFYAFLGVFVCHTLPFDAAFYRRFHLPVPALWGAIAKSGAAGVDLFFALSAFLITSLLLREQQQTGGISLRNFYLRRILRIWPLYFLVIAIGAVLASTVAGQKSSLVLRCGVPAVRRQLGARGLWPPGVGGLAIVDSLNRRAVLPDVAAAYEDITAPRNDCSRHRYVFAGDGQPAGFYGGRLEWRVHLLRQHLPLRLARLGHSAGAVCRSSSPAYSRAAMAAALGGVDWMGRCFGLAQ